MNWWGKILLVGKQIRKFFKVRGMYSLILAGSNEIWKGVRCYRDRLYRMSVANGEAEVKDDGIFKPGCLEEW